MGTVKPAADQEEDGWRREQSEIDSVGKISRPVEVPDVESRTADNRRQRTDGVESKRESQSEHYAERKTQQPDQLKDVGFHLTSPNVAHNKQCQNSERRGTSDSSRPLNRRSD